MNKEEFVRFCGGRLKSKIAFRLEDFEKAEDLCQIVWEKFFKAIRRIGKQELEREDKRLLWKIADNEINSLLRKIVRDNHKLQPFEESFHSFPTGSEIPVETQVVIREREDIIIFKWYEPAPFQDRELIRLKLIEKLPVKVISCELNLSIADNGVNKRFSRLIKNLEEVLVEHGVLDKSLKWKRSLGFLKSIAHRALLNYLYRKKE